MTRYSSPPVESAEYSGTMCGCSAAAIVRASCRNCSSRAASTASDGSNTLIATSRSRKGSCARKTAANPPCPRRAPSSSRSPSAASSLGRNVAMSMLMDVRVRRDARGRLASNHPRFHRPVDRPCQVFGPGGITQLMRLVATDPGPGFDPELIPRVGRGDPAALTALYHAFGSELLALARRLTGSDADAEDVLHDLIVGLPDAMRTYDERGKLRAWLRQIVVRMCLMRLRTTRRRRETSLDAIDQLPARAASAGDVNAAIEIAL